MANNYEQATVEPFIPERLVSELELALLDGFGFRCEKDDKNRLYFFAEECVNNEFYGAIEREVLEQDASPLSKRIRDYLVKAGLDNDPTPVEELPSDVVTWEYVFQTILSKPENRGKERITEIVAMAAYTCSKLRPGEFGGWCVLITKDSVKHDGTHAMIERMRRESKLPEALALVCELAEGGALDPKDADPSLTGEVRKQQRAIKTVKNYLKTLEA